MMDTILIYSHKNFFFLIILCIYIFLENRNIESYVLSITLPLSNWLLRLYFTCHRVVKKTFRWVKIVCIWMNFWELNIIIVFKEKIMLTLLYHLQTYTYSTNSNKYLLWFRYNLSHTLLSHNIHFLKFKIGVIHKLCNFLNIVSMPLLQSWTLFVFWNST